MEMRSKSVFTVSVHHTVTYIKTQVLHSAVRKRTNTFIFIFTINNHTEVLIFLNNKIWMLSSWIYNLVFV